MASGVLKRDKSAPSSVDRLSLERHRQPTLDLTYSRPDIGQVHQNNPVAGQTLLQRDDVTLKIAIEWTGRHYSNARSTNGVKLHNRFVARVVLPHAPSLTVYLKPYTLPFGRLSILTYPARSLIWTR